MTVVFNDVPEASSKQAAPSRGGSALAFEPSRPKEFVQDEGGWGGGMHQRGRGAGEEREDRDRAVSQTQRTRSPLNSKAIILATRNYGKERSSKGKELV